VTISGRISRPVHTFRAQLRVAVALSAGLGTDVVFDPQHRHVPLCPFHAVTGWWCPLCGGLRAADSLAHLHLRTAWHDNLLLVAGLPLLALWWLDWTVRTRDGRAPWRPRLAVVTLIVVAISFTVLRNLPFADGLRPPA
jgi:hypothetical protein